MVIQFNDTCVDCESARGIKQKELELFVQRFSALSKDEIAVEMMVSSKNIMNLLTHLVPCVGCRRRYSTHIKIITQVYSQGLTLCYVSVICTWTQKHKITIFQ